jgi:hypothetical protein
MASCDVPVPCEKCGAPLDISYNSSYGHTFAGSFNGLATEKIVVWEGPGGKISYPGRNDSKMPQRYADQGFVRRELMPWEVSGFEKQNHVACEALHWGSKGFNQPDEDPIPKLKIEDVGLVT